MRVADHAPLAPLTTLRLGGSASRLVTVEREADVLECVRAVDEASGRLLVLGGGSNLVIADAGFDGTVVAMATRGISSVVEGDGRTVSCTVKAGVAWDDFVDAMVGEGLAGIECLSGIPGLAGAVPIQNVGAYGQDASQTVLRVRAYDRKLREIVELRREACAFAYRTSVFRGNHRYVLLDVTFALERSAESRPIRYAELARALGVAEGGTAPLATVRQAVIALRRNKGMVLDPSDPDTRSAGSFFTNPILDDGALEALRRRARGAETVAVFPESNNRYKVSAAWLIERAGFPKGFAGEGGRVAVSRKHALALTTRSGASTQDLVRLARTIRDGVWGRFGVMLENEPVFVGVQL